MTRRKKPRPTPNRRKRVDRSGKAPHRRSTNVPVPKTKKLPGKPIDQWGLEAIEIAVKMAVTWSNSKNIRFSFSLVQEMDSLCRQFDKAYAKFKKR